MRAAVFLVFSLSGCMVFSESMRRSHDDAGTGVADNTGASSSSGDSTGGDQCIAKAPATSGADGCGGSGGGTFSGTFVTGDTEIALKTAACGKGSAVLTLPVNVDDCLSLHIDGASATIKLPDGSAPQTLNDGSDLSFHITTAGSIKIVVGDGVWDLVAH